MPYQVKGDECAATTVILWRIALTLLLAMDVAASPRLAAGALFIACHHPWTVFPATVSRSAMLVEYSQNH